MKIVLAALVRGYKNKHEYRNLIKRNSYLKKKVKTLWGLRYAFIEFLYNLYWFN